MFSLLDAYLINFISLFLEKGICGCISNSINNFSFTNKFIYYSIVESKKIYRTIVLNKEFKYFNLYKVCSLHDNINMDYFKKFLAFLKKFLRSNRYKNIADGPNNGSCDFFHLNSKEEIDKLFHDLHNLNISNITFFRRCCEGRGIEILVQNY